MFLFQEIEPRHHCLSIKKHSRTLQNTIYNLDLVNMLSTKSIGDEAKNISGKATTSIAAV